MEYPVEILQFSEKVINELWDLSCNENQFMRPKEMSGLIMTGILYFEKVFPQYLEENAEYYFICTNTKRKNDYMGGHWFRVKHN